VSDAPTEDRDWPSLGIVVPVYNEGDGIEHACREIAAVAARYRGAATVIAVDDGSADDSGPELDRLAAELDALEVVHHPQNAGYGAALRSGAERASELGLDYVAFIDSDLTNPPEDLLKIGELARSGHPYIKASRFVAGGSMAEVPPVRRLFSRSANLTAKALFGTRVRDVTNGFRAMRTDLFLSLPLHERGFAVIVEEFEMARRRGIDVVEFPTVLGSRGEEQRPTTFLPYSPALVRSYLRYPVGALLRRVRGRAGDAR
jgi:dolichol-phosphate mannosyltransferase